jgi:hypothetical protein
MILKPSLLPSGGAAGFEVTNSGLLEGTDQLTRTTAGTATDGNVWTLSIWLKQTVLGSTDQYIFSAGTDGVRFNSDKIEVFRGGVAALVPTSALQRDPSDYIHILIAADGGGTSITMEIDGVAETSFSTDTGPATWASINTTATAHAINNLVGGAKQHDGCYSEVAFIDGLALTSTSFGEFNASGRWVPIDPSGLTFGNNGCYLDFQDGADLGKDVSGNNNDWTNTGVTQSTDSPTTNNATINPLEANASLTLSVGNTVMAGGAAHQKAMGTVGLPNSGKYYFEGVVLTTTNGVSATSIGIASAATPANLTASTKFGDGIMMYSSVSGSVAEDASTLFTFGTFTAGDVMQVAIDLDNNKMWFGINDTYFDSGGTTTGNPSTGANPVSTTDFKGYALALGLFSNTVTSQLTEESFTHTPPTDFIELDSTTLPTADVNPQEHMKPVIYTGDGSASLAITGAGFQPDLAWIKNRDATDSHVLTDSVRGVGEIISSDTSGAEVTDADTVLSFDTDGITVGADVKVNTNTEDYVAWLFRFNNSSASNTNGTITSTTSANTSNGMSVVTYTGTGSNATVGHGLGATPTFLMVKRTDTTGDWKVFHTDLATTKALVLNSTAAAATSGTFWHNTAPTPSVFSLGTSTDVNASGGTYVAYCFTDIEGFSKAGSYTGNNLADGTFAYTGFNPSFLMIKNSAAVTSWRIFDTAREPNNLTGGYLEPDTNAAEVNLGGGNTTDLDILSNGFKLRGNASTVNAASTNVYLAFASNPFAR